MSKYTISIKNLILNDFDFGLDTYPIFDEKYRNTLNTKILNHYYNDEIGLETPELFKFYLNNKMNEIMDYYNILYNKQSELLTNLTGNVNLTETFDRTNETYTNTDTNSSSSDNGKSLFQDTPQGNIKNEDIDQDNIYATNITLNKNNINDYSSSRGNGSGTENYIKTIIGNNGGKYNIDILNEIKNNLINIDMLIINDLSDLFIGLY